MLGDDEEEEEDEADQLAMEFAQSMGAPIRMISIPNVALMNEEVEITVDVPGVPESKDNDPEDDDASGQ